MKPLKLKLKRFKGIRAGMGLEDISIDLENLPHGLIAVSGPNGSGKTTILDNLHPFRIMPYKLRKAKTWSPGAFSFYEQCYGRDAAKEFEFTVGDDRYRSVVLIDAEKRKQEAYLYVLKGKDWQPLNDGKTATYDEAVEKVCGTPQLFFTSVFRAQGAKNLSDYTRGDILEIITELLNIEHISEQGDKAGKVASHLKSLVAAEESRLKTLGEEIAEGPALEQKAVELDGTIKATQKAAGNSRKELQSLEADLVDAEKKLAAAESERKRLADMEAANAQDEKELQSLEADLAEVEESFRSSLADIDRKLARAERIASGADKIRDAEKKDEGAKKNLADLKARLAKLDEESESLAKKGAELDRIRRDISKAQIDLSQTRARHDREIQKLAAIVEQAEREVAKLEGVDCDGAGNINSGCRFIAEAVAARDGLDELRKDLKDAEKEASLETAKLSGQIDSLRKEESALKEVDTLVSSNTAEIRRTKDEITGVEKELEKLAKFTRLAPELDQAQINITDWKSEREKKTSEYERRTARLNEKLAAVRKRIASRDIDSLMKSIGRETHADVTRLREDVTSKKAGIQKLESETAKLQAEVAVVNERLRNVEKKRSVAVDVEKKIDRLQKVVSVWSLLAKACSNDGVVALEIDDAGPGIAGLANDLLYACYGSRYSVSIETQSEKTTGGLKEDFDIKVLDAETGNAVSITEMSGGQVCYIEDAITRAICLHNLSSRDFAVDTLFSDEKDGALDAERKLEFVAIKKKAMDIGGHSREIFISQTPELQELADARIIVSKGSVTIN